MGSSYVNGSPGVCAPKLQKSNEGVTIAEFQPLSRGCVNAMFRGRKGFLNTIAVLVA